MALFPPSSARRGNTFSTPHRQPNHEPATALALEDELRSNALPQIFIEFLAQDTRPILPQSRDAMLQLGLVGRVLGGADGDGGRRAPVAASRLGGPGVLLATPRPGSRSAWLGGWLAWLGARFANPSTQGLGCPGQCLRRELDPLACLRRVSGHRGQGTVGVSCPQLVQGGGGLRQASLDLGAASFQHGTSSSTRASNARSAWNPSASESRRRSAASHPLIISARIWSTGGSLSRLSRSRNASATSCRAKSSAGGGLNRVRATARRGGRRSGRCCGDWIALPTPSGGRR
jgi:hypothetical protein